MKVRSILAVAGLAVATSLVGAGTASADPGGLPVYLTCVNGATYQTTYFGGPWSPGPDLTSTTVFVPTATGEMTQTIFDADGNIIETDVYPAVPRATLGRMNAPRRRPARCSIPEPSKTLTWARARSPSPSRARSPDSSHLCADADC